MTEKKRLTSIAALRMLPAVFDLRDVEVWLGMDRKAASTYCFRWREKKLIKPLGPRVGVFYNLIVDPAGPTTRFEEAIYKLLGRPAIAIGATALHWHGWTTQRPHQRELAVITSRHKRSLPDVYGAVLIPRSRYWFEDTHAHREDGPDGFKVLSPAIALVDAYTCPEHGGRKPWRPDPDDIDFPDEGAAELVTEACRILRVDEDRTERLLSELDLSQAPGRRF